MAFAWYHTNQTTLVRPIKTQSMKRRKSIPLFLITALISISTLSFAGTTYQITSNKNWSAVIPANAPLSLTGSTFTFNNTSYFNTSYEVDMISSTVNPYDNSTMYPVFISCRLLVLMVPVRAGSC
jgi:hypothetical protein